MNSADKHTVYRSTLFCRERSVEIIHRDDRHPIIGHGFGNSMADCCFARGGAPRNSNDLQSTQMSATIPHDPQTSHLRVILQAFESHRNTMCRTKGGARMDLGHALSSAMALIASKSSCLKLNTCFIVRVWLSRGVAASPAIASPHQSGCYRMTTSSNH